MSWNKTTILSKFKQMQEVIDDWTQVYTFDDLCKEIGLTKSQFDKQSEPFVKDEWFKEEYERIIKTLESNNVKIMVNCPAKAKAMRDVLERYFGWAKEETEVVDTNKVEVTRTILGRRPDET